jgi:hypothetical protein
MSRAVISAGVVLTAFAAIGHTAAHAGTVYSILNSLSGTSVQNGWTVAGTIELQDNTVFGAISQSDIKSWEWTATNPNSNTTYSANSVTGEAYFYGNFNATATGFYGSNAGFDLFLPDGSFNKMLFWGDGGGSRFSLYDFTQPGSGYELFSVSPMDFPTDNAYGVQIAATPSVPSSVPEIDPASFGSVAAVLTGAFGLIEQRRRRRGAATPLTV